MSRFKVGSTYTIKLEVTDPEKAHQFVAKLLETHITNKPYKGVVVRACGDSDPFAELEQANELLDRAANLISQNVTIGGDDEKLLDDIERYAP